VGVPTTSAVSHEGPVSSILSLGNVQYAFSLDVPNAGAGHFESLTKHSYAANKQVKKGKKPVDMNASCILGIKGDILAVGAGDGLVIDAPLEVRNLIQWKVGDTATQGMVQAPELQLIIRKISGFLPSGSMLAVHLGDFKGKKLVAVVCEGGR
jgi:hypothetical protein